MLVNRFRVSVLLLVPVVAYTTGLVQYAHEQLEHQACDPVVPDESYVTIAGQRTSAAINDGPHGKIGSSPCASKPGSPSKPTRDSHQNCPVCQMLALLKIFPSAAPAVSLPDLLPITSVVVYDVRQLPSNPALKQLARAPPACPQHSSV